VFCAVLGRLIDDALLQVELGATAVEFASTDDRVTSVRLARADGSDMRVAADTVVLATGGVENARLLMLHEGTLPGSSAMTGRYFMEHPHVRAGTMHLPDAAALASYLEPSSDLEVLSLGDETQREERLLNSSVELRLLDHDVDVLEGPLDCGLYVRAEQAPNPDSRIVLGERRDRLGFAWPVLRWETLDQDWDSIARTVSLVATTLADEHGAVVKETISADDPWPLIPVAPPDLPHATWGNHHMGTTRMADNAAEGVVDRNSLVHGASNLYLAGSSVFPTGGAANPTFTIVAMAHRLADHLLRSGAGD